jgi:queuine/archaeosine tRNA-ribosyltransferase
VDSLAWRRAAGYGTIFLPGCGERTISTKARRRFSRPVLSDSERTILRSCSCPVCRASSGPDGQLAVLSESYIARSVHNVWTLLAEQEELRLAQVNGTVPAFLRARVKRRHRLSVLVPLAFALPGERLPFDGTS